MTHNSRPAITHPRAAKAFQTVTELSSLSVCILSCDQDGVADIVDSVASEALIEREPDSDTDGPRLIFATGDVTYRETDTIPLERK